MTGWRLKPKPHQVQGFTYMLKHHYCINGDDMGLGKSFQALMLASSFKQNTLIVCPAHLRLNWEAEITKSVIPHGTVNVFERAKDIYAPEGSGYCIISYEALNDAEVLFNWASDGLVICDEVHYLKEITSARTQLMHKYLYEYAPPRFIGLSGTPIKNSVPEWYSPLTLCSYSLRNTNGVDIMKHYPDKDSFCQDMCFSAFNGFRTEYSGLRKPKRLWSILKDKYIRREKNELGRSYRVFDKTVVTSFKEDKELEAAYAAHLKSAGKSAKPEAKRKSALVKVRFTIRYIQDLLDGGHGPVVVFSDHPEAAEGIANAFKRSGVIHGGVPVAKRQAINNDFQNGALDVVALTIGAGGTGGTYTRANQLVFNDISWVSGDNDQAGDRIDRIGQEQDITRHYIIGSPQDLAIYEREAKKRETIERAR
jgi:SWI/SNF-related matrix-associated actin-dependent regulator 1 of chromatin subfamily A